MACSEVVVTVAVAGGRVVGVAVMAEAVAVVMAEAVAMVGGVVAVALGNGVEMRQANKQYQKKQQS